MDLTVLSDSELQDLDKALAAEWERRRTLPAVEEAETKIITDLQDAGRLDRPDAGAEGVDQTECPAWVNPGVDHSRMYRQGDVVSHNGRLWRSETETLNHWEPGGPGVHDFIWRDITPEAAPEPEPEPVPDVPAEQPAPGQSPAPEWRTGVAYVPTEIITYQGQTYRIVQAHTSQSDWLPSAVPSLYAPI